MNLIRLLGSKIAPSKNQTKVWRPGRKRLRTAHGIGVWRGMQYDSYSLIDAQKRVSMADAAYDRDPSDENLLELQRARDVLATQAAIHSKVTEL